MFISVQNYEILLLSSRNFIHLSQTLTKLCHIKCSHLVNFYILLYKCEKPRYLFNRHDDVEFISQVHDLLKILF